MLAIGTVERVKSGRPDGMAGIARVRRYPPIPGLLIGLLATASCGRIGHASVRLDAVLHLGGDDSARSRAIHSQPVFSIETGRARSR